MSTTSLIRTAVIALLPVLAVSAQEHAYTVTDMGADGTINQTWSLSQSGGFAVGYSEVGDHDEGFVFDGTSTVFIGTPGGLSRSDLLGVNALGHAVGKLGTVHENGDAFLWTPGGSRGHIERLGTLGGSRSAAYAINDLDQIVGWTKLAGDLESRPFLWESGVMTPLPLLGGTLGQATWINNAGQIVGGSTTDVDGLQQFAVLWNEGTVTRLPPFHPGLNNIANYIHDNGDIAGSIRLPRGGGLGPAVRAAIWRDAELYLDLGTLADGTPTEEEATSWASGVNADGVVVGMSVNADRNLVPFVYRDGELQQLDQLVPDGWQFVFVGSGGINDASQIAVSGFIPGVTGQRALLLDPVEIVDTPSIASATLSTPIQAAPNPFRRTTSFRIASDTRRLEVFDAAGRVVRSLDATGRDAAVHWDGRDASGVEVAPGVYFARAIGAGATIRVLKLR